MSRFSLRLPSQNISESFEDSISPKPFRYSLNPNLDVNNPYQSTSRSYIKHQKRIGQPLQSNLKLKKILVDKTMKVSNTERSTMSKNELLKFVENCDKVEKIVDKFNEFNKISKFQNEWMGFHEIKPDRSGITGDSSYLKTLSDSCSPRDGLNEGQKLMQRALTLCKKKKEYSERSELLKIEEINGEVETPVKPDCDTTATKNDYSGLKISKPDSKQLKSDVRFRYVNRKVLLLRTLSQIAENENKPRAPPQTTKCQGSDKFIHRKISIHDKERKSIEERGSLLSYGILSPRGSNPILDLKADSLNVCSIENIPHAKPEPAKLGRFSLGNYGVEKTFRGGPRTARRDSVLSNTSIADGISEVPTQNTSIGRSTTLYPYDLKIKVPSQKEGSQEVKSAISSSIFNSRTKRLSTRKLIIPSKQTLESNYDSHKEVNSNTSLDQNMTWQFITTSEATHKIVKADQHPITSRNLSHRAPKKRQNIPKVACNKVRSLQSCLIAEPTSRKSSLTTREQQLNTSRKGKEFPVKVFDLLQKIHTRGSRRDSQQRRDSHETVPGNKLFSRNTMHSLNRTINESFEDKVDVSVVEETKTILNKYGYGNSLLALEPRDSIKTYLDLEKREEPLKAYKCKSLKSRLSFS